MLKKKSWIAGSKPIIAGFMCLVIIQGMVFVFLNIDTFFDAQAEDDFCDMNPSHASCVKSELTTNRKTEGEILKGEKAENNLLQQMEFDIGDGKETFMAYIPPEISSFYQEQQGSRRAVEPYFHGIAGKFINLSPDSCRLYWDPGNGGEGVYIADNLPFEASGTATFVGHKFYFRSRKTNQEVLARFSVTPKKSVYVYDPFDPDYHDDSQTTRDLSELNESQLQIYTLQKNNILFGQAYKEFTGRDWLGLYPLRKRPFHFMWQAQYFGQNHSVQTRETHFISEPPKAKLTRNLQGTDLGSLREYRHPSDILDLTLSVISCSPKAFEIKNFLSDIEINHIIEIATGKKLHLSTVGESGAGHVDRTRTSYNTWLSRDTSPIVDAIYRRAADVMKIDEALLRHRSLDEWPQLESRLPVAEELQLVHYAVGQQYTAHHDFGHPSVKRTSQPSRYVTLLLYLNEGMVGGQTVFPRWFNAEDRSELKIQPEKGKAVLFYNLLPDGNLDDLSQHASKPVIKGEKWLMNLWVWDPIK